VEAKKACRRFGHSVRAKPVKKLTFEDVNFEVLREARRLRLLQGRQ
jgi:hypothetical protein